MHEHDAHRLALLVIGRCDEQREIDARGEQEGRGAAAPRQHRGGEAHEPGRVGEALHGAVLAQSGPTGPWVVCRFKARRQKPGVLANRSLVCDVDDMQERSSLLAISPVLVLVVFAAFGWTLLAAVFLTSLLFHFDTVNALDIGLVVAPGVGLIGFTRLSLKLMDRSNLVPAVLVASLS